MKKEPWLIYIIGMCLGYISQCCWEQMGIAMGVLGYFITIMVILGMTFNDNSNESN